MTKKLYHYIYPKYINSLSRLILAFVIILSPLFLPLYRIEAQDSDFDVITDYDIDFKPGDDFVTVTEKLSIVAYNASYFLPSKGEREFILPDFTSNSSQEERTYKQNSLKITNKYDQAVPFKIKADEAGIIAVIDDLQDISPNKSYEMTLTYKTHELVDISGNITNLYVPGLPEDIVFSDKDSRYGIKTKYIYNASVTVPDTAEKASYIKPEQIVISNNRGSTTYSINQADRVGQTAWIQIGTEQYYYFKMVQNAKKTDNLIPKGLSQYSDLISTNVYKLPLPKEHAETNQRVFFSNISPAPVTIERDHEGNLTAVFEVPANEDTEIIIEGYIVLQSDTSLEEVPNYDLTEYISTIEKDPDLLKYTVPDKYWESDSKVVTDISTKLAAENSTLLDLVRADYEFVIDSFDYSIEKVEENNVRLGALAAFNGSDAVCMEYADATIALLRAQGIPARAAVGYGNDPTGAENAIGNTEALPQKIGHQWLQVWVPEYGWLSVDPTWGETGRTYIGGNLDHLLWYTIGDSSQSFIGTSLKSADNITSESLQAYEVYLQALPKDQFPEESSLTALNDVIGKYDNEEYDNLSLFLKTNNLGKAIVLVSPIVLVFIVTFVLVAVVVRVFRRG